MGDEIVQYVCNSEEVENVVFANNIERFEPLVDLIICRLRDYGVVDDTFRVAFTAPKEF